MFIENIQKIEVFPHYRAELLRSDSPLTVWDPHAIGWFRTDNDFPWRVSELTYCNNNKSYTLWGIHCHADPNQPAVRNRQPFFQWEKEMEDTVKILSIL